MDAESLATLYVMGVGAGIGAVTAGSFAYRDKRSLYDGVMGGIVGGIIGAAGFGFLYQGMISAVPAPEEYNSLYQGIQTLL